MIVELRLMDKEALYKLGRHIQKLRIDRDISLSQLAADAGIAKSNLSRLEQGVGNPTLDTIWRLATQLKLPFGELVAPTSSAINEDGVEVKLIEQGQGQPNIDAYWMSLAPHTLRQAESHTEGTTETITVISGALIVGQEGKTENLNAGESFTFQADQAHRYETSSRWASCLVVINYHNRQST